MDLTNFLILLLTVGVGAVIFLLLKSKNGNFDSTAQIEESAKLKAELSLKDQKLGEILNELEQEKSQKNEYAGKNKQMFAEGERLKAENKNLLQDKERLQNELARFQEEENRKAKEFETRIAKLDEAKGALDDEKARIRREDLAREEQEKAERDRMWAEHEDSVKLRLFELCKEPDYNFACFDNKNLPDGFGGKFKPDFMVEFLGQYVIFDAKVSRSTDNFQNYISTNVKSTAEKINGNPQIYPMVFFVVPTEAISILSKTKFLENGYTFYVITAESLPVILASFKKISAYELAEHMDPQERENIVNIIAEFDYHINMRNALDLVAAQHGIGVLDKASILNEDIKNKIQTQKKQIRFQQLSPTEIKHLLNTPGEQRKVVDKLTEPKVAISPIDLDMVQPIIEESNQ